VREVAARWKVSIRTVYRTIERRVMGKVRKARPPGPRRGFGPHQAPPAMRDLVCAFREKHPHKGQEYAHHKLKREGVVTVPSPSTIRRIWRKRGLMPGKVKRRQQRGKWEIARAAGPGFFQIDTVYLPGGRFAICAIDWLGKWVKVWIVEMRTARVCARFLLRLLQDSPHPVHAIQTDNGGEFMGAFHDTALSLGLKHFYAWTRCPDMNGVVERFNRTLKEESDLGAVTENTSTKQMRKIARAFVHEYNTERPHKALDYLTPSEYLSRYPHTFPLPNPV